MKLLVTGDRGYIGSVLVELLLRNGYEVVGLDSGYFAPVSYTHLTLPTTPYV